MGLDEKMKESLRLPRLSWFQPRPGPLLLIILDGIGLGKRDESDGVYLARTPTFDRLFQGPLFTTLKAHGTAVGLPSDKDMGNSEVGHNALGAGRVFPQGAKLVNIAIETGRLFEGSVWKKAVAQAKQPGATLHFIGLLSDGNVHSHISHLFALMRRAAQDGVQRIRIHALLDGRDVYERSALQYIEQTEQVIEELRRDYGTDVAIASGGGRMIVTMDRYNADWEIVRRGWEAHVLGEAPHQFHSAREAVETFYKQDPNINDQYLPPFVIVDQQHQAIGPIQDGDAVIMFNFRGDRAIEISRAFEEEDFHEFDRKRYPKVFYAGMMEYDGDLHIPKHYLVEPPAIDRPVGFYMAAQGIRSFAISETQKYGHVTYFWNGNNSGHIDEELETYIEIPSDRIRFDLAPRMKAPEITDKTIELLRSGRYQFGRLNFPNGDMVGHTGVPEAIIQAVECVDECTSRLLEVIKELNGVAVILADHGNADEMFVVDDKGNKRVSTSHSLNPVPFAVYDPLYHNEYRLAALPQPGLANVAATLLNFLGYEKPQDYEPSLIEPVAIQPMVQPARSGPSSSPAS